MKTQENKVNNNIRLGKLLEKNELLTQSRFDLAENISLLDRNLIDIISCFPEMNEMSRKEQANYIAELIDNSIMTNENYDSKIEEKLIRFGLRTDKFYGRHNHNLWNNGYFEDDYFGFGKPVLDILDQYIDDENDLKHEQDKTFELDM